MVQQYHCLLQKRNNKKSPPSSPPSTSKLPKPPFKSRKCNSGKKDFCNKCSYNMTTQPELLLEDNLIKQLQLLGYGLVTIADEKDLLANLKNQLEIHNGVLFSRKEFDRVLNILSKGSVFDKAKILREKQHIVRDNGESLYFEFISQENWCQNQFQVTHQVTVEGSYKNRYDVTLLINGLPLVQIELKRRGIELKEAFNQVNRYQRHSRSEERRVG